MEKLLKHDRREAIYIGISVYCLIIDTNHNMLKEYNLSFCVVADKMWLEVKKLLLAIVDRLHKSMDRANLETMFTPVSIFTYK